MHDSFVSNITFAGERDNYLILLENRVIDAEIQLEQAEQQLQDYLA